MLSRIFWIGIAGLALVIGNMIGSGVFLLPASLAAFGASDPETRPTHWFARQNEGKFIHQTGVLLGKLGIDLPRRYDVICTNLPVSARGQVATPDSDHDLVWARIGI